MLWLELRRLDSNERPPGYEPGELPTAPLRDINVLRIGCFRIAIAKVVTFFVILQIFEEKNVLLCAFSRFHSVSTGGFVQKGVETERRWQSAFAL